MEIESSKTPFVNASSMSCFFGTVFVLLKMISGSNLFLILFLATAGVGMLLEKPENKIKLLLFFTPWAYAIKFHFTQTSLFTVITMMYCLIMLMTILMNRIQIPPYYLISMLLFVGYILFSLMLNASTSLKGAVSFLVTFAAVYLAVIFIEKRDTFKSCARTYAAGLAVSSVITFLGSFIPRIRTYLESYATAYTVNTEGQLYSRFSGLDIDPNYYAIQILIGLSCLVMLVLAREAKLIDYLLSLLLIIFGLLSLSKMFLLSLGLLLTFLLLQLVKTDLKQLIKVLFLLTGLLAVGFIYAKDYFYEAFLFRFLSQGTDASSLTTGRSTIWLHYLYGITEDFKLMVFGNGVTGEYLNGEISHNMYLIAWYYLGIVGILIVLQLFFQMNSILRFNLKRQTSLSFFHYSSITLLLLLIANFALDSFIMHYFGVHLFLVLIGINSLAKPVQIEENNRLAMIRSDH